jgi:hypothetical protein
LEKKPSQTAADEFNIVKFDTDQLPAILNALETDNGGNRLVLEVAVSSIQDIHAQSAGLTLR